MRATGQIDYRPFGLAFLLVTAAVVPVFFLAHQAVAPAMLLLASLLVISRPEYGLLALLATLPVNSFMLRVAEDTYRNIFLADMLVTVTAVSWLLTRLAGRRPAYPGTNNDWLLALFLFWAGLSLVWTPHLALGSFLVAKVGLGCLVFGLCVTLVRDRETLQAALWVVIAVGVVEAALCYVSIFTTTGFMERHHLYGDISYHNWFWAKNLTEDSKRGHSTDTAHNIGVFLDVPFFFCMALFLVTKSAKRRAMLAAAGIVIAAGVMTTMTKGAWAALIAGWAFVAVNLRPLRGKLLRVATLSLAVMLALFLLARAQDLVKSVDVIGHQLESEDKKTSVGSRLSWWTMGMQRFLDSQGLGWGAGGFIRAVDNFVPDGTHAAVVFDFGLPGALLWLGLFVNVALHVRRVYKRCRNEYYRRMLLVYLGGFVMLVLSWTVTLHYGYMYPWAYLGLGYALANLAEQASPEDRERLPFDSPLTTGRRPVW